MIAFAVAGQAPWLAWIGRLRPDGAVLLATLGLCLIAWELNRPGMILPGAGGLLLVLFAGAALGVYPLHGAALVALLAAGAVLAANLWRRLPGWLLALAVLALIVGLRLLVAPASTGVQPWCAVVCGGLVGGGGAVLSRIAWSARRAKAVN